MDAENEGRDVTDEPKWIWRTDDIDIKALNASQEGSMGGFLGIRVVSYDGESITVSMPVDARTKQPFGRLHGGASVVLAETAGSIASNLVLDTEQNLGVGLEINANHVRPAKDGHVFATVKAEALGRTTQVWSIRITDEQDRLVCVSRFTAAVIPAARA